MSRKPTVRRSAARTASRLALASGALALVVTSGCFYSFRTSVPGHIKTIAIPVFKNETLQPAVENEITQAIIERFEIRKALDITEASEADAVLEGTLTGYDNKVFRFDEREQAQEYVVTLTLNVAVKDRVKHRDLWSQDGIRTSATYQLGGVQARTEADARKEAVQQLAEILFSRTVEGW